MNRRTAIIVGCAVAVLLGTLAFLHVRHQREVEQQVAIASADAVTATQVEDFVDQLVTVRTAALEARAAARDSGRALFAEIERAREQHAAQVKARRVAARRAAVADAGSGNTGTTTVAATRTRPSGGLLIGDSVSLGAESCLQPLGYEVDSEVGRQFTVGLQHLRAHTATGLPGTVVLHLGTNGPFSSSGFDEAMSLVGGQRRVVWVTIQLPPRSQYSFAPSLNDMIRSKAREYDNVRVADFAAAAADHPEWLAPDGIHIAGPGCAGFAGVVDRAVTAP
ncbi:MAG: hypothetical protein U0R64_09745 [Candidatus Nanopelagicales bacterium]